MATIKFNDEIIDLSEFDSIYYLGDTSVNENERLYNEMKNVRNKIYNVLDFYPYIMNIYFTNKCKMLERNITIQDYKYNHLQKKIKYLFIYTTMIYVIIIIKFFYNY
jgi:hypothetical protein